MNYLIIFIFPVVVSTVVYASPLEDIDTENNYSLVEYQTKNLKSIFKEYFKTVKKLNDLENQLSPEAKKLIEKNKKFINIGRIKAFSKVNNGVRGKSIYIYKDFGNQIANINLKGKEGIYILTTFIDKKILKNKKLYLYKYMENVSIRQTGVGAKKKEII